MRWYLLTLTVIFLVLVTGVIHADPPATQPAAKPPIITGTLEKFEETSKAAETAPIATVLGHNGVLFIRSEARWDELSKLLPDLTPDTPLPKVDFAKQSVVLVYMSSCRPKDTFSLAKSDLAVNPPQLSFLVSRDISPEEKLQHRSVKFILAVTPAAPTVKVTVSSAPLNTDSPAVLHFSAILGGKDGGDIVDSLQASIMPKATTIKPGEDILIDFALHGVVPGDAMPQPLGTTPKSVSVWVVMVWGGVKEGWPGYRNHAFIVLTPDGKTSLLRPAIYRGSLPASPLPRPVEISANYPFRLSPESGKSLKGLGLDTSAPGTYTITGLYEETGGDEGKTPMWGGSITSNTITVEVKK